jgi:hypothetical protein
LFHHQTLAAKRAGQLADEAVAATAIQAAFRGFATRPHNAQVVRMQDERHQARVRGESSVEVSQSVSQSVSQFSR